MIVTTFNSENLEFLQSVIKDGFFGTTLTHVNYNSPIAVDEIRNTDPEIACIVLEDGSVVMVADLTIADYFTVDAEEEFVRLVDEGSAASIRKYVTTNMVTLDVNNPEHRGIGKYLETHPTVLPDFKGVYYYCDNCDFVHAMDRDDLEDIRPKHTRDGWVAGRSSEYDDLYLSPTTLNRILKAIDVNNELLVAKSGTTMALNYKLKVGDVINASAGRAIVADITGSYDIDPVDGERVTRRGSTVVIVCGGRYSKIEMMDYLLDQQ